MADYHVRSVGVSRVGEEEADVGGMMRGRRDRVRRDAIR